jgi:hypothetical protein
MECLKIAGETIAALKSLVQGVKDRNPRLGAQAAGYLGFAGL